MTFSIMFEWVNSHLDNIHNPSLLDGTSKRLAISKSNKMNQKRIGRVNVVPVIKCSYISVYVSG